MNPIVANNRPVKVDLTEGKEYYFCACGRSNKQPFCDGSHVGTEFKPKPFTAEKSGDAFCVSAYIRQICPFAMVLISSLMPVPLAKKGRASKRGQVRFPWQVPLLRNLRSSSYINWPGMA